MREKTGVSGRVSSASAGNRSGSGRRGKRSSGASSSSASSMRGRGIAGLKRTGCVSEVPPLEWDEREAVADKYQTAYET
jgi:hypothetical protein